MSRLIKILHIDPHYQITYFIYRDRSSIRTSVSLETAIELLKKEDFDLIISEPHHKAILKRDPVKTESFNQNLQREERYGGIGEIRNNRHS
jgi:hypothetical protein